MHCSSLDLMIMYIITRLWLILGLTNGDFQEAEELFETISQALLSSVDRDCLSGWGGHVYVV